MFNFFKFIPEFLGQILLYIYENITYQHYGWAIILFTIFVKVVLMPLTIKQQRSASKTQEMQPLMKEIQRKYKNDKEKQSQEMMKLYQEHKFNPMSGCFPLLVQMPILFSLFYVIKEPFTYMLNMSVAEMEILKKNYTGFYWQMEAALDNNMLNMVEKIGSISFNLGKIPVWNPSELFGSEMSTNLPLFFIPIIATLTTYLSTKIMMAKANTNTNPQEKDNANDAAAAMQKNMLLIGPLMTGFISFQAPAALGLYWLTGNIFQIIQQLFLNKFIIKKKEAQIE